MSNTVRKHYQTYPYPHYPLIASVRRCDTYALNLQAIWMRFNRCLPPAEAGKLLIAGCGTFSPYPFSLANPDAAITALDISGRSLARARLHCLLHLRRNVDFRCGDIQTPDILEGKFGLIDSYGVLHHLNEPAAGLRTLREHLMPGGIIRIMLYSRYARREEESIRRALRLLGISTPAEVRSLLKRATPGSRLAVYMQTSHEAETDCGMADALLHPCVRTYRIDEILELISDCGLRPLLFAHGDALESVQEETQRLRELEKERRSPGNFVIYLGADEEQPGKAKGESRIVLNPCLKSAVCSLMPGKIKIRSYTGQDNPPLGYRERSFLRRFINPVPTGTLKTDLTNMVEYYKRRLFLLEYLA